MTFSTQCHLNVYRQKSYFFARIRSKSKYFKQQKRKKSFRDLRKLYSSITPPNSYSYDWIPRNVSLHFAPRLERSYVTTCVTFSKKKSSLLFSSFITEAKLEFTVCLYIPFISQLTKVAECYLEQSLRQWIETCIEETLLKFKTTINRGLGKTFVETYQNTRNAINISHGNMNP